MLSVLKEIEQCQPGELIRLNVNNSAEWAIVGARGNSVFWIAVLTGVDAPKCLNIAGDWGILPEYENAIVLSYGSKFSLAERLDAACNISDGPLFELRGSLIQAEDRILLCCGDRYFNIKTGVASGAPGRSRAAFAEWILWVGDNPAIAAVVFPPLS